MMMLKTFGFLPAALLAGLVGIAPAQAQDAGEIRPANQAERPPLEEMPQSFQIAFWLNQAALAFDELDYEDWAKATERLHALRPYNQDFMTHLVRAYAEQGKLREAYDMMLAMQQQGLAQDWSQYDELAPMRGHRLYNHLNEMMTNAKNSFGDARTLATLDDVEMPEALAFDPQTERYFLGTIREGEILVSDEQNKFDVFADSDSVDELMAVLDVEVDAERRHLWVATAALTQWRDYRDGVRGRTLLLKLDLDSGELLAKHRLIPDRRPHAFGALAVAKNGTVFAADTASPGIYRLKPGDQFPQLFFTHPNFASMRGIALSDDDGKLYLADYEIGIFVVDTTDASKAWKLFTPENLNEGGIDGVYFWQDHLVVIQNGISPQRVLRLQLGDDGLGVVQVAPLVASLPQFDTPTYGVVADNELVFFANSHWPHVDSRGLRRGTKLPDVTLMATEIDSSQVINVGSEMLDELLGRQRENQDTETLPDES